ncbi:MAG: bacillithiol system redox-active protein YtxJ [Acidobacteriota bacterium]
MANHFFRITDKKAIDELANQSKDRPVVIFKHSLTCPISAAALDQMEQFDGGVALVEVQRARDVSNEIENRLGIPHESPQVIVLRNGQVAWNASHFKITADAVSRAVRMAEGQEQGQEAKAGD